jgi:hypothetical protein
MESSFQTSANLNSVARCVSILKVFEAARRSQDSVFFSMVAWSFSLNYSRFSAEPFSCFKSSDEQASAGEFSGTGVPSQHRNRIRTGIRF